MASSFNILTDSPTLIYPNGGEIFTEGRITIQWSELLNVLPTETIWYEIFITDNFDVDSKSELIQVATIPYGNSSYNYYIHKNLKGNNCRIGIRAVKQNGIRSPISFSADNFTITNKMLPSPAVLEPIDGGVYFSYIPIIFEHDAVMGRCSQRSFYHIFYSSEEQNIEWTLAKGNIMVGSDPFDLDVSDFPTSSDYSIKIELVDDRNVSPPLFLNNITINNVSYFTIDTVPPKGSIKIINNTDFIKDKDIMIGLEFYDRSSGVKDFQIEETDENIGTDVLSPFFDVTPTASWDVNDPDGVKLIKVRYRDYGDNVIPDFITKMDFRAYKSLDNRKVTAFLNNGIDLYIAFARDEENLSIGDIESSVLYKNQSLLFVLSGNATALEYYNDVLYIAIRDHEENKAILQRASGGSIQSIVDNDNQYTSETEITLNALYRSDSVINTMEVFDSKLFMGLQNGELLSFNGSTITVEHNDYLNSRSINFIKTDDNLLYIFFKNTTEILIMNKNSRGDYIFTTVDTGN